MISLSNLAKYYGDRVLFENVSLQFNRGERYGIVGANGCGKSTLLKMLTGEESVSDGSDMSYEPGSDEKRREEEDQCDDADAEHPAARSEPALEGGLRQPRHGPAR